MTIKRRVEYGANRRSLVGDGITASGRVKVGTGIFHGLILKTDGTNDVTVNVYDNTEASGSKLLPADVVFDGTANLTVLSLDPGIIFDTGLYLEIACLGTTEIKTLYNNG